MSPVLTWDEHSHKPWRELRTSEHIMLNQARAPDGLIAINSNERGRNLVMATSAFYSRNAIINCLAWAGDAPTPHEASVRLL